MTREEAQEQFLAALGTCDGLVYNACHLTGLDPKVHEKWLATDEAYAEKYHRILEGVADFVEGAMFKKIRAGDWQAIKFYLTSKCAHRGYVTDGANVTNVLNLNGKPVKSLSELLGSLPMEIETQTVPTGTLPGAKTEVLEDGIRDSESVGAGAGLAEDGGQGQVGLQGEVDVPRPDEA